MAALYQLLELTLIDQDVTDSVDMMCAEREDSLTVFCSLNKLIPPELQLHCHANDVLRGFYGRINPLASPSKSGLS